MSPGGGKAGVCGLETEPDGSISLAGRTRYSDGRLRLSVVQDGPLPMDSLGDRIRGYVSFLAAYFRERMPANAQPDEEVRILLHGSDPLWQELRDHEATRSFVAELATDSRFINLHEAYYTNRQHLKQPFEHYLTSLALDLALTLVRRAPPAQGARQVDRLADDFLTFTSTRLLTFVETAPLFNFTMDQQRLDLDSTTWIGVLDGGTKANIVQAVYRRDIIISQKMLDDLRFAIFRTFSIPVSSTKIAPPEQDLAMDAELALCLLKPAHSVTCGYLEYRATGWGEPGNGGARLSLEFRWPGPMYALENAEAQALAGLYGELVQLAPVRWVQSARYFQTARGRLMRAAHEQLIDQRLLDLFISIESLVLRAGEYWRSGSVLRGASRFAMLVEPASVRDRDILRDRCEFAHMQRNTVAHGIDRDLVGFDGLSGTFHELAWEVDGWARQTLLSMLRLVKQVGTLDTALSLPDQATTDATAATQVASAVQRK